MFFRYFFLTKNYWIGSSRVVSSDPAVDGSLSDVEMNGDGEGNEEKKAKDANIEREPAHLPLGVNIRHLSKVRC